MAGRLVRKARASSVTGRAHPGAGPERAAGRVGDGAEHVGVGAGSMHWYPNGYLSARGPSSPATPADSPPFSPPTSAHPGAPEHVLQLPGNGESNRRRRPSSG